MGGARKPGETQRKTGRDGPRAAEGDDREACAGRPARGAHKGRSRARPSGPGNRRRGEAGRRGRTAVRYGATARSGVSVIGPRRPLGVRGQALASKGL